MSIMKQSTLNFSAAKRTASTGKPKVFSTPAIKPKASLPAKAPSQRKETSEDDIENYDDFVLRDTSSEEIESDSKSSSVDATEVTKGKLSSSGETLARTTRSWTKTSLSSAKKPGTEKEEAASQPFRNLNPIEPEDLERNVEITSDSFPELDPSSRKWNELHNIAKAKLGGPPIHGKDDNKVQQILRVFDNSYEYGPCVGMTRLERWERAESLGLSPPKEVYEMLITKQGQTLNEYKQSVFHGEV